VVAVLVWGRKKNSVKAHRFADRRGLPVWYLEDGFVRNCESDLHSRKSYSLIVDQTGVYYDSTGPSDIENLLNLPDDRFAEKCDVQALREASKCRNVLIEQNITKYNYCRNPSPGRVEDGTGRELVLIVDQTANDASVRYGGMSQEIFEQMLDVSIAENPGARIVMRTHPDVVAGRRKGYLHDYASQSGVEISAEADNPIVWLKAASRVYVGTSQLGYEALLCGCQVTVFGQPFYAGWGLTDDRNPVKRRTRTRSLDQLFFAAHMSLARYCDPLYGQLSTLRDCLSHVVEQKRNFTRNAYNFHCVGITPWKRRYLARYLRSPEGTVTYAIADSNILSDGYRLTWSYRFWPDISTARTARVEDGFLRSQGLGSDFVAPASLVIDMQGMYFDRHQPSELENLLETFECTDEQRSRAAALREMIVASGVSKYNVCANNVATANPGSAAAGKTICLIIGQVENDQSILRGCDTVNSNMALCQEVRRNRPEDYLIYRPHPDVESGNREGAVSGDVLKRCVDEIDRTSPITMALNRCDELHTMTSLTGFEALLRLKEVFTYGLPFYSGWGLTKDNINCNRRTRKRSLDELVFLTLIAYPRYLHVESGEFITPEQQVQHLSRQANVPGLTLDTPRWINKLDNIVKSLRYAA
ncbi:hypothetical protein N9383_06155, partial [Granulosicoccus sp.]|nr:hypothetical protein [Granulosicoccus sp.]